MRSTDSVQALVVHQLASLIRRLPAGRRPMADLLARVAPPALSMRLPRELGGLTFECEPRELTSRFAGFTGCWEPTQTLLVTTLLRPGMTFVDVGAHWGYFTLIAASRVRPRGRVLSIEPHPEIVRRLRDNVDRNRLAGVTVLDVALGAGTGRLALREQHDKTENSGGSWLLPDPADAPEADDRRRFEVSVRTLDDIADEHHLGVIDLLKMDIEGAEGVAVQGMSRLLAAGRVQRLLVELHPQSLARFGGTLDDLYRDLRDAGYRGLSVDESLSTTRAVGYGRLRDVTKILSPLPPSPPREGFPHQLWLAPGAGV